MNGIVSPCFKERFFILPCYVEYPDIPDYEHNECLRVIGTMTWFRYEKKLYGVCLQHQLENMQAPANSVVRLINEEKEQKCVTPRAHRIVSGFGNEAVWIGYFLDEGDHNTIIDTSLDVSVLSDCCEDYYLIGYPARYEQDRTLNNIENKNNDSVKLSVKKKNKNDGYCDADNSGLEKWTVDENGYNELLSCIKKDDGNIDEDLKDNLFQGLSGSPILGWKDGKVSIKGLVAQCMGTGGYGDRKELRVVPWNGVRDAIIDFQND